ncbi:MarR family transcriptional regulator [bacterium]|nr:MarR family transcriptional regulator [bacterium]
MSIYDDWGFSDNPFQTTALPPTQLGCSLLIGRDIELQQLQRRLTNPPKLPTLEGLNGVGKSSLVNVAAFNCYSSFLSDSNQPMLIPCRKVFQLRPDLELQDFIDDVLREVAQTLIEEAKNIKNRDVSCNTGSTRLDRWLNSPQLTSYQGGVWVLSAGRTTETNTGEGFTRSGFRKSVVNWLAELFPTPRDGGVVCTIDNLELLQTSEAARRQLEVLRDELLTLRGLRWVLCGALGIVLGVVSSPRLEGLLHTPVSVTGVDDQYVDDIFESRLSAFAISDPYLPITAHDFRRLYGILAKNLRSLLGHADDYCQWIVGRGRPEADEEKSDTFHRWLTEMSEQALLAAQSQLRPRAWEVFDDGVGRGGTFSPSDYEEFGFNSIPAFRPAVRDLESAGLLVSTQDEGDKRRKTIQVTPKGWLVNYARRQQSNSDAEVP